LLPLLPHDRPPRRFRGGGTVADLEKEERQRAEHQTAVVDGVMEFRDVLALYRQRLAGDASLKPRSKVYREERIAALLKSWRGLEKTDVRKISKTECLTWAAEYGKVAAPSNFNNTVGTLRLILEYDNLGCQFHRGQFAEQIALHVVNQRPPI
jgi:hypothetical protein